ncbi:MAG: GIY-YIG nuclease family protein [Anaerolineae bacterium]|nr:GIY-YIG nuclease family protein [Anaerolineae bacterium]
MAICYTYIVRCADDTLYTGWTTDLARRVAAHNAGRGGRYTRSRRPVELVYWEMWNTPAQAMQREAAIKHMSRASKLRLIETHTSETSQGKRKNGT